MNGLQGKTGVRDLKIQTFWKHKTIFFLKKIRKNLKLLESLCNTLQILSAHSFDKTPFNERLMDSTCKTNLVRKINKWICCTYSRTAVILNRIDIGRKFFKLSIGYFHA